MEIDSTFYLVLLILGLTLLILGLYKKAYLFNILTIPIWMFFAVEWSDSVLLVLTMIGLIFMQLYFVLRRDQV